MRVIFPNEPNGDVRMIHRLPQNKTYTKVTLSSGDMVLTIGDVELGTFRLEATRHVALPGAGKRDSLTGVKADLPAGWHGFVWSNNQALALGIEFDTRTGYFKVQATVTIDLGAAVLELSGTVESCEESDSEYADWTSSTVGAKFSTKVRERGGCRLKYRRRVDDDPCCFGK